MSSQQVYPKRPLGNQGLVVSAQGIGCMGMTAFYGSFNRQDQEEENLKTIAKALEIGITMFDTAWLCELHQ
jgi:aryl-alcohol dehydrogenase-like predicted oxidoreductase